jgi:hypothetical protein
MIEAKVSVLCHVLAYLRAEVGGLSERQRLGHGNDPLDHALRSTYSEHLKAMAHELGRLGIFPEASQTRLLHKRLAPGSGNVWTSSIALEAFVTLISNIGPAIDATKWVRFDRQYNHYIGEAAAPWGHEVFKAFPSARNDIRDSGLALGVGLPNASVFHAMRTAEKGLRVLARDRRVRTPAKLQFEEWGTLIAGLSKTVETHYGNWPRGSEKDEVLNFYQDAIANLRAFASEYRHPVSHSRRDYDEPQARLALTRVESFMKRLALKLSELNTKPLKWKKPPKVKKRP